MRRARPILGTIVEIRAETASPAAERAIGEAFAAVARVHLLMSVHRQDSDVSRLNRHGHKQAVRVHPWTFEVLEAAERFSVASDGLFDCTVAPALSRDGFLPRGLGRAAGSSGSYRDVELLPGGCVRFQRPLAIDLGGIAKGFAVDRAVTALRTNGVLSGAVNAGGDLRVFGPMPQPIHLRDPAAPGRLLPAGLLRDGAIATSAGYFARRPRKSGWVSPIVDPRNGAAVADCGRSVSVIAEDALTADALTKPVMLLGADSEAILRRCGARALIHETGGAMVEAGHAA
ncbi:MAG: FAD:protein FMN transferase [Alphaproteobacteria bacterium]|nr:FAD:protein FMN transferase [Hyphomicrobiales bacterium]MBV8653387.1 FAD:protein FMN transferase [Alphaproteobacteria bacterium]